MSRLIESPGHLDRQLHVKEDVLPQLATDLQYVTNGFRNYGYSYYYGVTHDQLPEGREGNWLVMRSTWQGNRFGFVDESGAVGLAAPQVFVSLRIFLALVRLPEDETEPPAIEAFINPILSFPSADSESAWEGCLSFPELMVLVPRHTRLQVDYYDLTGQRKALELAGFAARVVQHEYDHLDGILTIDRAASTRDIIKASEIDAVKSLPEPEAL